MRDAKTFYESSYATIKAKTDKELQSYIRAKRDSVDAVSIATRAMCKYELMSRADQARKQTKPQSKTRPASPAARRTAERLLKEYNNKRRSAVLEKMSENDPERANKSICEMR